MIESKPDNSRRAAYYGQWPFWSAHAYSLALTLAFVSLAYMREPTSHEILNILLIPIMLSAYVGGVTAGMASILITVFGSIYFLVESSPSFQVATTDDAIEILIMAATGMMVTLLIHVMQKARKRASAVPRLREQITQIAESVPGVIYSFRLRPDGSISIPYASPMVSELFGLKGMDLSKDASPIMKMIDDADRPAAMERITQSAQTLTPWHAEFRIRSPNLGLRWLEGRSIPRLEKDGSVLWHGFVADITDRKQAEAALAETHRQVQAKEAMLRALLDSIPDLVFFKDTHSAYLGFNKAFEKYTGKKESELVGKTDFDLSDPEIAKKYREADQEVMKDRKSRRYEEWIPFQSGGGGTFETLKTPFHGPNGDVIGMIGVSRDITERIKSQKALDESRERYRSLFENMLEGCSYCRLVQDENGLVDFIYLDVNPSFERLSGLKGVRGRRMTQVVPGLREAHPDLLSRYESIARGGGPMTFEYFVAPMNQWFSISAYSPAPDHFVAIFELITDRKLAELALRESEQRFRTTLDSMMEGCQIIGYDFKYIYINDSAAKHGRVPRDQFIGRRITDVYPGFEKTELHAIIAECLRNRERRHIQNEFFYSESDSRWFDLTLHPVPEGVFILSIDITEQRRAADILRQSEERFRQLFDRVSKLAVQGYAPDGTVTMWNKASELLYGYTAEEAIGRNLVDLIIPAEVRDLARQNIRQMLESGVGHHAEELILRRKDGSRVPVYSNHTVVDVHGRGKELYCIDIDLTAHKAAEKRLQESEERLTLAIAAGHLGVWEWDIRNDHVFMSPEGLSIFGWTQPQVKPEDFFHAVHPDDRAWVAQDGEAAYKSKSEFAREYRIFRSDGAMRWVADRGHIRCDANGNPMTMIGTVHDITARKETEEGLRVQSAALQAAANAIVITDRHGNIQWANHAFTKVSGYSFAEAAGKNPRELIKSGQHDSAFYANLWNTIASGLVWRGEIINKRKDGSLYTESMVITPVRDEHNAIVRYVAIKQDITEQKKLEAQLLRTQRLESVGRLASGIAHDLNNILSPMLLGPPILREAVSDASALEIINSIESSATRGAAVIQQLLTFGRGLDAQRVPIQLRSIVRDMMKIIQETFPKNIAARQSMPGDLQLIHGDATQIHQVLMNLCVNARDAMPAGGVLTLGLNKVDVSDAMAAVNAGAKAGPHVVLSVKDTGSGIPSELLDKIFDPFFTTKKVGEGTGLGLSTVLGIVRSHKGFITVDSEIGVGTEFKIFLPVCETGPVAELPHPKAVLPRGQNEIILVVDDEENVRRVTRRMLEQSGYQIIEAHNGAEALALLQSGLHHVDLVLTDLMMPVMDGPTLIQNLHKMNPSLRIISMSGYLSESEMIKAVETDTSAFLPKPFTAESLTTVLRRVLVG